MKLPQNLAHESARDRASAGRLFRVNAALSSPGARPVPPAGRRRDERSELAEARRASGLKVATAALRRKAGAELARQVLARKAAQAAPKTAPAPTVRPDGGPVSQSRVWKNLPRTPFTVKPPAPIVGVPPRRSK